VFYDKITYIKIRYQNVDLNAVQILIPYLARDIEKLEKFQHRAIRNLNWRNRFNQTGMDRRNLISMFKVKNSVDEIKDEINYTRES
jgi:hypothetical protein